jgi:hypothetical protein
VSFRARARFGRLEWCEHIQRKYAQRLNIEG